MFSRWDLLGVFLDLMKSWLMFITVLVGTWGSGLLDKSCFTLELFVWNVTKVLDLSLPPLTLIKWVLPSKRCSCWVFVASWSIKLYFLYLPPWLLSLFRDLSWLIHGFCCTLGDTTPNTFLLEKVWLHRCRPKRPSRGIFSLCVVTVLEQIKVDKLLCCHICFSWQNSDSLLASPASVLCCLWSDSLCRLGV